MESSTSPTAFSLPGPVRRRGPSVLALPDPRALLLCHEIATGEQLAKGRHRGEPGRPTPFSAEA
jgi:hypothetical protein